MNRNFVFVSMLLCFGLFVLAGCTTTPADEPSEAGDSVEASPTREERAAAASPTGEESPAPANALREVTLAMGFIPNVQFAPFYVAVDKGFYADEGIEITFDYGMESDLVQLVGANELQFAIGSGEQVLLGRAGGLPVRYVGNLYRRFPVAVTSIEHDISEPQTLEGKTVGLPGLFGANYIGWLALVEATGIDADRVNLEAIGFNQVPILVEGQVDAAVVYATNEPLILQAEGYDPSTIYVADYIDIVSNGLITNDTTIENDPDLVQGMVRAMIRGVAYTLDHPDEAFEITRGKWVPEISDENAEAERAVLDATLEFWQNEQLGVLPRTVWETNQAFMLDAGLIDEAVPLDELYTNEFAEKVELAE